MGGGSIGTSSFYVKKTEGKTGYLDAAYSTRTDETGTSCTILDNKRSLTQEAALPEREVLAAASMYVGN